MTIEDIILTIIIILAVIYAGRRIYLILFSNKPHKCCGCNSDCLKEDSKNSECSQDSDK